MRCTEYKAGGRTQGSGCSIRGTAWWYMRSRDRRRESLGVLEFDSTDNGFCPIPVPARYN